MFEFKKLCDSFEKMSSVERGLLLTEKSVTILAKLHCLSIPGIDPVSVFAGFLVGSVVSDGKINEKEYLIIYPTLVRVFGDEFDLSSIKASFCDDKNVRKVISDYTENMIRILELWDDELKWDLITLCLCIVTIDEKVSFKEKRYIRRLCGLGL